MSKSSKKKGSTRGKAIVNLINGNFLTKDYVVGNLPFLLFLAFLALIYIANGCLAQDSIVQLNKTNKEIKELRSEYITTKSELMYRSKQSQVAKSIKEKGLGLEESVEPPKKIIIEKEEK